MKHENGTYECPRCDVMLDDVHPDLVKWYKKAKQNFINLHISCGWRGELDQNAAYDAGASKLRYPFSPHNYVSQDGKKQAKAVDLFELIEGRATFPMKVYHDLAQMIDRDDDAIDWGGRFRTLGDGNHFELRRFNS